MVDWYPILRGNCNQCAKCVVKCPIQNMALVEINGKKQVIINDGDLCIKGCTVCKENCHLEAIAYYDGTEESVLNAFSGMCGCH